MSAFLNGWRYYRLGRDDYKVCMEAAFLNNISALRWANLVFFILAILFSVFPVITEKNFIKSGFYLGTAVVALLFYFIANRENSRYKNRKKISSKFIYILILLYYVNVMFFGLYLAVWAEPEKIAGSFIGIFICVLFLFNISPALYLSLTLATLAVYITAIINVKIPSVWNYDIQNAFFAGFMGLIFGWQIIMSRMTTISNTKKLKDENTIDELTQLKNRRDYMTTFQRFLTNHRQSDNFLCVAIMDIDWFKNYNDHYGHPQGDECLRMIGKALKNLHKDGIYTARIGGEEFALLWHAELSSDAENVGMRVNQIISDLKIPHEKSNAAPYITVSIGIHVAKCDIPHEINDLYNLADKALYAAKNSGRNCTVVSS
ncbi:MAG: GGDEF domain-containing protein [Treponema sp.]|nr:GGDEF domain-containing protein [Treponema sp.]